MLTFPHALERATAYSPQPGQSDQERADIQAFIEQASLEERAALRGVIAQKNSTC